MNHSQFKMQHKAPTFQPSAVRSEVPHQLLPLHLPPHALPLHIPVHLPPPGPHLCVLHRQIAHISINTSDKSEIKYAYIKLDVFTAYIIFTKGVGTGEHNNKNGERESGGYPEKPVGRFLQNFLKAK